MRIFFKAPHVFVRLGVQAAFALFHVYLAWEMARFLGWVAGRVATFTPPPPAAEGYLPIVALMSLKRWLLVGHWEPLHPAALTIFLALLAIGLLFRRGFCAFICPLGFLSNLLDRLGRRLGLALRLSGRIRYLLWLPKYLILGGSLAVFVLFLDLPAIEQFRQGPHYIAADGRMFRFFASPSATLLLILGALAVFSVLVRNFWCRFLCPYGALLGLAALFSPVAVQREQESCVQCGRCARACPNGIAVDRAARVNTPECVGCGECVGTCPVPGCLELRAGPRRVPWWTAGAGAVVVLLLFWGWGKATGHWDTELPAEMLRRFYLVALGS